MDRAPTPEALLLSVAARDLAQVRAKADAHCRQRLAELSALAGAIRPVLQAGKDAYEAGAAFGSEPVQRAIELAEEVKRIVELTALVAVKGAVMSGRWPEEREDEAHALCADEAGLYAFIDAMERVPIGFVDQPAALPAQH